MADDQTTTPDQTTPTSQQPTQESAAASSDPQATPSADQSTTPAVTPDPTPTSPSTSSDSSAPSNGETQDEAGNETADDDAASPVDPSNPNSGVTPDLSNPSPSEDHSPPAVVGASSNVAPSTTGSGSTAAPDQTSGTPLTGIGPEHETDGAIAPAGSTADGAQPDMSRAPVAPVTVDNRTRRSGDDALLGSWVDVIGGPNSGRYGSYVDTVHHDAETGYPTVILIRSRDARNELLEVAYEDVRPSDRNGGR